MPICKNCGEKFPHRMVICGKRKLIGGRKYCLKCSPYKQHNTRRLLNDYLSKEKRICEVCNKEYYVGTIQKSFFRNLCHNCYGSCKRIKVKYDLIQYKGGKCEKCGYDKIENQNVFTFHHLDPSQKDMGLSSSIRDISILKKEADKCILLCCRCHAELHNDENKLSKPMLYNKSFSIIEGEKKKREVFKIKCHGCGNVFEPKNKNRKYCSRQ